MDEPGSLNHSSTVDMELLETLKVVSRGGKLGPRMIKQTQVDSPALDQSGCRGVAGKDMK